MIYASTGTRLQVLGFEVFWDYTGITVHRIDGIHAFFCFRTEYYSNIKGIQCSIFTRNVKLMAPNGLCVLLFLTDKEYSRTRIKRSPSIKWSVVKVPKTMSPNYCNFDLY